MEGDLGEDAFFRTPELQRIINCIKTFESTRRFVEKGVSCEQQLDLSVFEHDQRDVTDGMRTLWKLPVNVALKNYVFLTSACPEVPVECCFFDYPILFEVIRMFQAPVLCC